MHGIVKSAALLRYATSDIGELGAQLGRALARSKPVIASDHGEGICVEGWVGDRLGKLGLQDAYR